MIYNQACEHCRQKLRRGLVNAYTSNPIRERKNKRRASTSSMPSSTFQCQHPWLNERMLGAFDEPLSDIFQTQPQQPVSNALSTDISSSAFQPSPDEAFDEMLQTLETEIESEKPNENMPGMFDGPLYGSDILSFEARALLRCVELDRSNAIGDWWASPSFSVPTYYDFLPSPFPAPPLPSPVNTDHGSPYNPALDYFPRFHAPLLFDDCWSTLPGSKPAPRPMPGFQQTTPVTRSSSNHQNQHQHKPPRKFHFVLEDIGGKAPVFIQ
ncbi:hypothetical protein N7490_004775 [Penicillium lividum]|nr:hypothetical protein N7490_004775 [Penicillium lividum]